MMNYLKYKYRYLAFVLSFSLLFPVQAEKTIRYELPVYTIFDPQLESILREYIRPFLDGYKPDEPKIITSSSYRNSRYAEDRYTLAFNFYDMETLREKFDKGEFKACSMVDDMIVLHPDTIRLIRPQADSLDISGYFDAKYFTGADSVYFLVSNVNRKLEIGEFRLEKIDTHAEYKVRPTRLFNRYYPFDPIFHSDWRLPVTSF